MWKLCYVSHIEWVFLDEWGIHVSADLHAEDLWWLPVPGRRKSGHLGDHRHSSTRLDLLRAVGPALRQRHAEGWRLPLLLLLPADLHARAGGRDVDRHYAAEEIASRAGRRGGGGH